MADIAEKTEVDQPLSLAVSPNLPPPPAGAGGVPWSGILRVALPLAAIAIFLLLWNWLPTRLSLSVYTMPTFSEDMNALVNHWGNPIGPNLKATIVDALAGFLVGNLLAVIGAILFSQSKYIEWTFFPLAILFQTIPIIVVAPLMVNVLGVLRLDPTGPLPLIGVGSKPILVVTILISFFPTLVNMSVGLRSVDPNLYDLMRLLTSSRLRLKVDRMSASKSSPLVEPFRVVIRGVFTLAAELSERCIMLWRLRLPSSMPYLFSSFKITSTLCFVGAVVGEWMLTSSVGIGGLLNTYQYTEDYAGLWASVIAVSVSSMAFFGIVILAERLLLPWREER